jgi:hypothetical protein
MTRAIGAMRTALGLGLVAVQLVENAHREVSLWLCARSAAKRPHARAMPLEGGGWQATADEVEKLLRCPRVQS